MIAKQMPSYFNLFNLRWSRMIDDFISEVSLPYVLL